jgi:hypothetical protein
MAVEICLVVAGSIGPKKITRGYALCVEPMALHNGKMSFIAAGSSGACLLCHSSSRPFPATRYGRGWGRGGSALALRPAPPLTLGSTLPSSGCSCRKPSQARPSQVPRWWQVRDKLLGKDSLDIDIALDDMLGKDFAQLVNTYLQSQASERLDSDRNTRTQCRGLRTRQRAKNTDCAMG